MDRRKDRGVEGYAQPDIWRDLIGGLGAYEIEQSIYENTENVSRVSVNEGHTKLFRSSIAVKV